MLAIDDDRILADLRTLAGFGKLGTGVDRTSFTEADMAARQWLCGRMAEAGLEAAIDGVGNVYGRTAGVRAAVLLGSHTDSVPGGGWLDGALGVIYGVEIARACRLARASATIGVDVVSFADEEGTFLPLLGSRSFCGELSDEELTGARNSAGAALSKRLADLGLGARPPARLDPSRYRAYLEAHIEQGPRLVSEGIDIGVVTGIVGVRRYRVAFRGRADHAGTTPMAMRRDAAFALFNFAVRLAERFRAAAGPDSVWNFGVVTVKPGAGNVVPSEAELVVEFRDQHEATIRRFEQELHAVEHEFDGAQGVSVAKNLIGSLPPAMMDADLRETLAAAADELAASRIAMPSGAGHDAMILARHIPSAMLFVPSVGGRSHDISEDTSEIDIRRGAHVFARAVELLLARFERQRGPNS